MISDCTEPSVRTLQLRYVWAWWPWLQLPVSSWMVPHWLMRCPLQTNSHGCHKLSAPSKHHNQKLTLWFRRYATLGHNRKKGRGIKMCLYTEIIILSSFLPFLPPFISPSFLLSFLFHLFLCLYLCFLHLLKKHLLLVYICSSTLLSHLPQTIRFF